MDSRDETSQENITPVKERIIPSVVGDIHVPNAHIPFDMNFEFKPGLTYQFESQDKGYGVSTTEKGIEQKHSSFIKTAGAEFYDFNATAQLLHAGYEKYLEPNSLEENTPADFKPTNYPEMLYDIDPKNLPYLMDARGIKDLQYRRDRVLGEQQHDELLENGSTFAKIIGGVTGAFADPVGWIPILGAAKYAKLGTTFMKSAARALPGIAGFSAIQSGAKELDRTNGNLSDFVLEAGINTVIGTAVFGGIGVGALALDKMEIWNLRNVTKDWVNGINYKLAIDEKGKVTGIKAFDTTNSLSAAQVSRAQEIANSSFNKSGFFKIPYVGTGLLMLKGAPIIGSPLVNMINSPYKTVRAFIDRAADHSFITEGVAKGETQGKSFEHFMKREFADLRGIAAQMNALHLERMGFSIKSRPLQDTTQAGLGLYNAALKKIGKDTEKYGYVPRGTFDDEVQRVLYTGESSEHAAVNSAAGIMRKKIDDTWVKYKEAYGKSTDLVPPKMAAAFLMRVYDTPYMNLNKDKWVNMVTSYLRESDQLITQRMQPITALEEQIKNHINIHQALIEKPQVTDKEINISVNKLTRMKKDLSFHEEKLQDELRSNPDYIYHLDDIHALSAQESKELTQLLKPLNDLKVQLEDQKKLMAELNAQKSKSVQSALKGKTTQTAKKHSQVKETLQTQLAAEKIKLNELENKHQDEEYRLYSMARNGEINPAFYYPETHQFKDPDYRLKFRNIHASDIERANVGKAYYDSIMHMNPEDIIADVMGKLSGSKKENTLRSRSVIIPDEILYNNNFMTKDLMSKVNNYVLYLSRRTHLKNVFQDVSNEGGIEPLIEELRNEHLADRSPLESRKESINERLSDPELEVKEKDKLNEELKRIDKKIINETKKFNKAKEQVSISYERMMGLRKRDKWEIATQGVIRSLVAMANLHFLPATQLADLGAIGLQSGVWPFVRDAVYPVITSFNGLLKTKESEAIRETAGSLHLALQDVLNGHADKNISLETQPYLNLGRWVGGAEKLAHYSSNLDLTTYIDNYLQRLSGAVWQSEFMRALVKHTKGIMSDKEGEMLRKYGIDPNKWSERMVKAYQEAKGFKTKLGGHQSMFWKWQDLEAANEFSSAVFRGIQNTIITRGMFDSPFWADNMLGMIFHTFTGWGFASVNRYLIPLLQRPDAEKMLGVLTSIGFGALVSPVRRMARGEDGVPDNMSDVQRFWEVIYDSSVTSALADVVSWANLMSGDRLLGDLKSDRYKDRIRVGAGSAIFGTANRIGDVITSLGSGEINQQDALKAARILPVTGTLYGYGMSKAIIDSLGLPPSRRAARAEKD
jgi:hypothetical protein